jgi:superkiller protein 3
MGLAAIYPIYVEAESIRELHDRGDTAQENHNFAESVKIFQEIIKRNPHDVEAYYELGISFYRQGNLPEAINNYYKAIELGKQTENFPVYQIYYALGNALLEQESLTAAIRNYQRAIANIKPKHDLERDLLYHNLGYAFQQKGEVEAAIEHYQQAIQINSDCASYYNSLGGAFYENGNAQAAIENYRQAIQLNSKYSLAYYNLGNIRYEQRNLEAAIENYRQAIQLDSDFNDAYYNLGNALSKLGEVAAAIENYRQAIQLNSDNALRVTANNADVYINLGYVLIEQGEIEAAIESYRQAIQIEPNNANAYNNLGYALQKQGNLQAAIEKYKHALHLKPNYATAQHNLDEVRRLLARQQSLPLQDTTSDRQVWVRLDEKMRDVLRSTVRIISKTPQGVPEIGTGWVIKREGNTAWIVTNRHVVQQELTSRLSKNIELEFYSQQPGYLRDRYQANVVEASDVDSNLDLAVLKVTGIPDDIQPLEIQRGEIPRLTEIFIVGHPRDVEFPWNVVGGEVTNYNPQDQTLIIDARIAEGDSGGPVINRDNHRVVGLIAGLRTRRDIYTNPEEATVPPDSTPATRGVGKAYRINRVLTILKEWGILE